MFKWIVSKFVGSNIHDSLPIARILNFVRIWNSVAIERPRIQEYSAMFPRCFVCAKLMHFLFCSQVTSQQRSNYINQEQSYYREVSTLRPWSIWLIETIFCFFSRSTSHALFEFVEIWARDGCFCSNISTEMFFHCTYRQTQKSWGL